MAPKGALVRPKPVSQAFKDKTKPADVRSSNISAAKGIKIDQNMLKNDNIHTKSVFSWVFYDKIGFF